MVNARQKKVSTDYHPRAKSLDARGGDTRDGFEAELNSYGQGGRLLRPVVGAFGDMSNDVKELANAVAEEPAVEHCSFYGDKASKAVKGFFLNQLYRSWGTYCPPRMGTAPPRPPQFGSGPQCPTSSSILRR